MNGAIHAIDNAEPWIAARDWALVTLLFGCGLRISEALSLRNSDIAGAPESLRIVGKGAKERIVPVLPAVYTAIKKYTELRPFGNAPTDELFRVGFLCRRAWRKRLLKNCGITCNCRTM